MYSEKVMDHFQHPRNVGEIENASGVGTVGNAKPSAAAPQLQPAVWQPRW